MVEEKQRIYCGSPEVVTEAVKKFFYLVVLVVIAAAAGSPQRANNTAAQVLLRRPLLQTKLRQLVPRPPRWMPRESCISQRTKSRNRSLKAQPYDRLVLDLRTVFAEQEPLLVKSVAAALR